MPGGHIQLRRKSEAFIRQVLAEAESAPTVLNVLRKYGISKRTYYNWRERFGRITPTPSLEEVESAIETIQKTEKALARLREILNMDGTSTRDRKKH